MSHYFSATPLLADHNASPVHFRSRVVIRPTTRHTDDPSKVTCGACKSNPAFIEARDERARLLAERSLLTDAVKRTTRAVEIQTERLHSAAQRLSTALDDEKAARRDLTDWTARQESAASPSGSTQSAETVGSVPEVGPDATTPLTATEGLRPVLNAFGSALFCSCENCNAGPAGKYAPGPF